MKVVLDTNVLVSGFLSPKGPPGDILRLLETGFLVPCLSDAILAEYRDVLSRPHFGISKAAVDLLLEDMETVGLRVVTVPLPQRLPDSDDEAFLEVTIAARADFLVTGNLRDFPAPLRQGIAVVSPREFLEALRPRS